MGLRALVPERDQEPGIRTGEQEDEADVRAYTWHAAGRLPQGTAPVYDHEPQRAVLSTQG